MSDGFMGLNPEQARKVARHLRGSGDEIQKYMKDITGYFAGVEWFGEDMKRFQDDLNRMAHKVGGQAGDMVAQGHTVEDRVRKQQDASR
jgi:hypothetical protein